MVLLPNRGATYMDRRQNCGSDSDGGGDDGGDDGGGGGGGDGGGNGYGW